MAIWKHWLAQCYCRLIMIPLLIPNPDKSLWFHIFIGLMGILLMAARSDFFSFFISSVRIWNLQLLEVCSGSRTWPQCPAQLTCATAGERRQEGNYRSFWKVAARPQNAPALRGFNRTYPVSYENTETSNKWNRCMQSKIRKQPLALIQKYCAIRAVKFFHLASLPGSSAWWRTSALSINVTLANQAVATNKSPIQPKGFDLKSWYSLFVYPRSTFWQGNKRKCTQNQIKSSSSVILKIQISRFCIGCLR